jgi:hypothetical protein
MSTTTKTRRTSRRISSPKQITHAILYRGPSLINGAPIVVVALYREKGTNEKTGAMVQTYILPDETDHIMDIMRDGRDAAVCGGCPHRYDYDANGAIAGTRTCYVNLGQGVRVVLEGVQQSKYLSIAGNAEQIAEMGRSRMVRLGTWGDPASVPVTVWTALLSAAKGHTGYTHQWRSERLAAPMRGLVMASCETDADVTKANAKGFTGTFHVLPVGSEVAPSAMCPASAEAGKVATCADCGRCDGKGGNVQIVAHGSMARKYLPTLS